MAGVYGEFAAPGQIGSGNKGVFDSENSEMKFQGFLYFERLWKQGRVKRLGENFLREGWRFLYALDLHRCNWMNRRRAKIRHFGRILG